MKKTKIRKKDEIDQIAEERQQWREERDTHNSKWEKHWDREEEEKNVPKRLGGGRKPTLFRTDKIDYDKVDSDRSTKNRIDTKLKSGQAPARRKVEGKSFNSDQKPVEKEEVKIEAVEVEAIEEVTIDDSNDNIEPVETASTEEKTKRDFGTNRKYKKN